jgi:hypothetical protein
LYPLALNKRYPKAWLAYVLCYGVFPAFTSIGLMSYGRYVLAVFPLFVLGGDFFQKYPRVASLCAGLSLILQGIFAGRMGLNYWVC